jgi:xanthine dehydrogenase molybdenum-binding subunit
MPRVVLEALKPGPIGGPLGSTVRDKLGVAKVTGAGRFVGDMAFEGALCARLLVGDVAHAEVRDVDLSAALAIPGVVAAVGREAAGLDTRLRQHGDMIAAVAAETQDQADAALSAITYDLDPLPALFDAAAALVAETAMLDGAEYDDPGLGDTRVEGNVVFADDVSFGDLERGFAEADLIVEGNYRTGRPVHANLSRHGCIATLLPDGRVEVETSVDGPYYAQRELAKQLGMDPERIIVRVPELLSSSFGAHSTINPLLEPVAVALALQAGGRPVRFEFESQDEFLRGHTRHAVEVRMKSGVRNDGTLTALEVDLLADHGSFPNYISRVVVSNFRDRIAEVVRLENYHFRGRVVATNNINASEMRAIGTTQAMFCLGSHLDEVASQLRIDPVALYERNALITGETVLTTGNTMHSTGLRECLERGAVQIGWDDSSHSEKVGPSRYRGLGVGIGTHTTGLGHEGHDTSRAVVRLEKDGTVTLLIAAPDSGQGGNTAYSQVLAEELGIAYESIRLGRSDTIVSPKDMWGTVASRGVFVVGAAVGDAARKARERLLEEASARLGVPAARLTVENEEIRHGDRNTELTLGDLITALAPLDIEGIAESSENPPTFGAYFAEVEVDTETGQVEVTRVAAALDVGFAVNPQLCRGQVEGAVMMGIEMVLLTSLELVEGFPENASYLSIRLATTRELPEIDTILVEATEPTGPYGAKGIGTPALAPVAPAIANAVSAALGRRVSEVPIRPEWVVDMAGTT